MYTGPSVWLEDLQNQGLITEGGNMSTLKAWCWRRAEIRCSISLANYNEWAAVWNKGSEASFPHRGRGAVPHLISGLRRDAANFLSGGPNIQNFRKKEGIRECIVARHGALVASLLHWKLENCTLAAVIYQMLWSPHDARQDQRGPQLSWRGWMSHSRLGRDAREYLRKSCT